MLAIYIWHEEFSAVATHLPTFSLFVQTQYCNYIIKKKHRSTSMRETRKELQLGEIVTSSWSFLYF